MWPSSSDGGNGGVLQWLWCSTGPDRLTARPKGSAPPPFALRDEKKHDECSMCFYPLWLSCFGPGGGVHAEGPLIPQACGRCMAKCSPRPKAKAALCTFKPLTEELPYRKYTEGLPSHSSRSSPTTPSCAPRARVPTTTRNRASARAGPWAVCLMAQ